VAIPKAELQQRTALLTDGLRRAGIRLTSQRLEICSEIAASSTHPDAETVFNGVRARVPTISLDTVYRTLHTLRDLGLIGTLGIPSERMRFDVNSSRHHHFVCTHCGEVRDFHCEGFDHLPVPNDLSAVATVHTTQVEIRGVCRTCFEMIDH
jgi:Fur family transcriptional regulator, peroxide stress response regulator